MTTSDNDTKFRYLGNAVTDTFSFPARIFTEDDLVAEIITRATDVLEETLTITTDYTVTITGEELASVTTVAGKIPSALQDIQIRRSLAQTQTVDLPTGTVFPAKSVEDAMDRVTAIVQEVSEDFDRAITLSNTSSLSNIELATPAASEVIGWDDAGTALTSYTFAELSTALDTVFTGLVDKDMLRYDNGIDKWVNEDIGEHVNAKTSATITASDEILFADVGDSNLAKKSTVQGILDLSQSSGLVFLGTYTASADTSVDIGSGLDLDAVIDGTYDEYELHIIDIVPATDGAFPWLRTSTDGGIGFDAGASDYGWGTYGIQADAAIAVEGFGDNLDSELQINFNSGIGNAAGESGNFVIKIFKPSGTNFTQIKHQAIGIDESGQVQVFDGGGARLSAADVNAIRVLFHSGNIASGVFKLYGVRKS